MATDSAVVRGPTWRGTYGLLLAVGFGILAIGLVLPFLIADPVNDQAAATGGLSAPDASAVTAPTTTAPAEGAEHDGTVDPGAGPSGSVDSGGSDAAAAAATTAPAAQEERTASDVGITADTITVGIPITDTSGFGDVEGGAEFTEGLGDLRAHYQAQINDLNKRGGINGRQVVAEFRLFDIGDPDSMRAACIYLTEEKKSFAVLGGFFGDPLLCFTEQHQTPLIAQASEPDDFYARSNGFYFSLTTSKDRILRDMVHSLHRDGLLTGKTIGILDDEGLDHIPVDRTLLPTLKELGYEVKYHARIASDLGAAQSQIPLEVQQMSGTKPPVDTIIVATGLIRSTVFAQEAKNQRYFPQYLLSDFASGATDIYTVAMPDTFEGSIGYTSFRTGEARAGIPEDPQDRVCRETYERETGKSVDRKALEYFYMSTACGIVGWFEQGLTAAGVNPTQRDLSDALQALGPVNVPFGDKGSFGPGKFDAPDTTRRVEWKADCKCWLPVSDFRAP